MGIKLKKCPATDCGCVFSNNHAASVLQDCDVMTANLIPDLQNTDSMISSILSTNDNSWL